MCLKLYHLLYADEKVILGETATALQNALDRMNEFCNLWSLTVNTEVVILPKVKLRKTPNFEFK